MSREFNIFSRLNNRQFIILGIFVFSVAVRLLYMYCAPLLSRDAVAYVMLVLDPASCDIQVPPLLNLCMSGLYALGIPPHIGGRIVNILAGSLLPVVLYLTAGELGWAKRWQCTAAVLASVHPMLVLYSVDILRESLYLFFAALTVYCVILGIRKRVCWWAAAGVTSAMAAASRLEALEFLMLIPIILLLAWVYKLCDFRKIFLSAVTFCLSWAAVIAIFHFCFHEKMSGYFSEIVFFLEKFL